MGHKKPYRKWPKAWHQPVLGTYFLCKDRVVQVVVQIILTTIRRLQLMTVWHIPHLFQRLTDLSDQSESRLGATLLPLATSVLL